MAEKKSYLRLLKIILLALTTLRKSRGEGDNQKIYGGTEIVPHSYPWLVDLWERESPNEPLLRICGGSIIHREWIMTALHCFRGTANISDVVVIGGRHEAGKNDEMEQTARGMKMVSWEPTPPYEFADIALVRVMPPFNITEAVQVANLPPEDMIVQGQVTPVGWGKTERENPSKVPLKVDVSVVDQQTCQEKWKAYKEGIVIQDDEICAGGSDGKGACQGDSGGPLNYVVDGKTYVVGVVSGGHSFCNKTGIVPDVFVRVTSFARRIKETIPKKTCKGHIVAVGASS